jgi:predicted MFS family arabinose efflux permease
MQAYLGDRVPYAQRGRALDITELSWSLSFLPGAFLIGLLIQYEGWASPFLYLGLFGVVAFIGLAWMLPRDELSRHDAPGLRQNLRSVFTYGPALTGLALGFSAVVANEVINLVFGVWMEESFGLKIAGLGAAAAAIGLAELCGESLVAFITDKLGKARAIRIGLTLNSLAALALTFLGRNLPGAFLGLFLFYLTFEFTIVSMIPLMTEMLPSARTTMMAANITGFSLGRAAGALLAPSLYSYGILVSGLAAVLFNLAALFALRHLPSRLRG